MAPNCFVLPLHFHCVPHVLPIYTRRNFLRLAMHTNVDRFVRKGEKNAEEKRHLMKDTINHVKHSNTFNEILTIYHAARFIRIYLYFFLARLEHTRTHKQSSKMEKPVRNQHALFIVDFSFIASFISLFFSLPRKINLCSVHSLFVIARVKYNKIPRKCHGLWFSLRKTTKTTTKIQQQKCAMQIRKKKQRKQ